MHKFNTFTSSNCSNFDIGSKRIVNSGMGTMNSIMALKDHYAFKFVHGSRFPRHSKHKVLVFMMFVDLPDNLELEKMIHHLFKLQHGEFFDIV